MNFSKVILIFLVLLVPALLPGQEESSVATINADTSVNYIFYGFDKFENIFNFSANSQLNLPIENGTFRLRQKYKGTAIQTENQSFRDDEYFNINFIRQLFGNLSAGIKTNWFYYADSRFADLNNLNRLNNLFGLQYVTELFFFETYGGIEQYKTSALNTTGSLIEYNSILYGTEIAGISINGLSTGEFLNLGEGRNVNKLNFDVTAYKNYNETDLINLDLKYKLLDRDFYATANIPGINYSLQNRFENITGANLKINYSLSDNFISSVDLNFLNLNVDKSYDRYYNLSAITGTIRKFNDLKLGVTGGINYISKKFKQNLSVLFNIEDKDHTLVKRINNYSQDFEREFDRLQQIENKIDYIESNSGLFGSTIINFGRRDILNLNYSASLLRYDTPNDQVNDDRDEFNSIISLVYSRKFSDILRLDLLSEMNLTHLVYIKKEMSATNNWKRIIRFSPRININTKFVKLSPQIEVLANYTVYDYEGIIQNLSSRSFRQISYRDSLTISLNKFLTITSRIYIRYYEDGTLYWGDFAETPNKSSFEQFINILFLYPLGKDSFIGAGARYYRHLNESLGRAGVSSGFSNYDIKAYAPETVIKLKLFERTTLYLYGWYEMRYNNDKLQIIPNLVLNTGINL